MAKIGRPKDIRKKNNRVHSVLLNEKAEIIYRKICKKIGTKWFSELMSKTIIDKFGKDLKQDILTYILLKKQKERDKLEDEMSNIVEEMKNE